MLLPEFTHSKYSAFVIFKQLLVSLWLFEPQAHHPFTLVPGHKDLWSLDRQAVKYLDLSPLSWLYRRHRHAKMKNSYFSTKCYTADWNKPVILLHWWLSLNIYWIIYQQWQWKHPEPVHTATKYALINHPNPTHKPPALCILQMMNEWTNDVFERESGLLHTVFVVINILILISFFFPVGWPEHAWPTGYGSTASLAHRHHDATFLFIFITFPMRELSYTS